MIQDTQKAEGKKFKTSAASFSSAQRAILAANGVTGVTANDINLDTQTKQGLDEAALRYNADVKSWETNEEAKNRDYALRAEAGQYRFAGKQARSAAKRNVFSTLLGTATSIARGRY